jgi:hypothetical protein
MSISSNAVAQRLLVRSLVLVVHLLVSAPICLIMKTLKLVLI